MATQVLNFQKLEVCAFTKEEAKAQLPFEVMKDATQALQELEEKTTKVESQKRTSKSSVWIILQNTLRM